MMSVLVKCLIKEITYTSCIGKKLPNPDSRLSEIVRFIQLRSKTGFLVLMLWVLFAFWDFWVVQ